MRVVWSPLALSDLRHVEDYIREHDPRAAIKVARKIKQATRRLADYPASGRPGRVPNTRELVVPGTHYIVPYTVSGNEVWIIAIMHAARQWPDS